MQPLNSAFYAVRILSRQPQTSGSRSHDNESKASWLHDMEIHTQVTPSTQATHSAAFLPHNHTCATTEPPLTPHRFSPRKFTDFCPSLHRKIAKCGTKLRLPPIHLSFRLRSRANLCIGTAKEPTGLTQDRRTCMIQKRDKHRRSLCKEKSNVIASISLCPEASTNTGLQSLTLVRQYIDYKLLALKPHGKASSHFPYSEMHVFEVAIADMQGCISCIDYIILHDDQTTARFVLARACIRYQGSSLCFSASGPSRHGARTVYLLTFATLFCDMADFAEVLDLLLTKLCGSTW
jgi:hypothetical protein